jgi:hypothetical protein
MIAHWAQSSPESRTPPNPGAAEGRSRRLHRVPGVRNRRSVRHGRHCRRDRCRELLGQEHRDSGQLLLREAVGLLAVIVVELIGETAATRQRKPADLFGREPRKVGIDEVARPSLTRPVRRAPTARSRRRRGAA